MKKRLLVLSFDALGGADYDYLKTQKPFQSFFADATVCTDVSSVYPSVTYACHTSIVTGKTPVKHGIISNTLVQPERINTPDWYWQRKYIKGETIYDVAIKNGYRVAAFLWPVTAKSKIQYILPEIFPNRKWDNQILTAFRNGSPLFLIDLFRRYRHMLNGIKQPNLDDFVTQSTVHTIKKYQPELMLVHFTDLDTARHDHGVNSPEAYAAMDRLGQRFEKIMTALKEENLFEETVVCILGDHYQLDYTEKIPMNERLCKAGYLTYKKGKITSWDVIAKSNGGSVYLYAKPHVDKAAIYDWLLRLKEEGIDGVEAIYTGDEAGVMGADNQCLFMLEAKLGFVFTDSLGGGEKGKVADHGYHPIKKRDYQTFFAMNGPGIAKNADISGMSLLDIAPTWARLLGLELNDVDGFVVEEFFI